MEQEEEIKPTYKFQQYIDKIMMLQRINDTIAMILDGKQKIDIVNFLVNKYGISSKQSYAYISQAHQDIKKRKQLEIDNIIDVHLGRYEWIYGKLVELKAHTLAASVLKAKENLLQFHKHNTHMKVENNQFTTVSTFNVKADYDFNRVSEPKRERLQQLIGKME